MESLRSSTLEQILQAKSKSEIEAIISLSIHKLKEHKTNPYLIARMIEKIQINLKKIVLETHIYQKRILLMNAIQFLNELKNDTNK